MVGRILSVCLAFGVIVVQNEARRILERLNNCGPEAIEKCSDEHRLCGIFDDGNTNCGQCQLGYIEFSDMKKNATQSSASCVEISEITWQRFATTYDPFYRNAGDSNSRLQLLKDSAQFISEGNVRNRNGTYTLGLTPYSADTAVEYQQRSGYFYINVSGTGDELMSFDPPTVAAADISMKIDWTAAGAVTLVKDQGRCGSSWAIGVCGVIEGAAYLNDAFNESVSFQQLISCNKRNLGCDGGSTTIGAKYLTKNWFGGITTLDDYPYTDARGLTSNNCSLRQRTPALAVEVRDPISIAGLHVTMSFDKRLEIFKLALMEKPISIILKSSCLTLSNYVSGILTEDGDCACSNSTCYDHAVLMVGYDDTDETPYFKLKNSWGTRWGEDGYFRIAQREKGAFGLFGIFGEGVMIEIKQNVDADMLEVTEDNLFPIWATIAISMLSSLCCCFCTYMGCVCWARKQKEYH